MNSLFEKVPGAAKAIMGAALAALPVVLVMFTSCASSPKVEKASTMAYHEGVPGGTLVESYKIPVKVDAVDAATRKVTLVAPDGSRNTFTAEPADSNFDQLHVGDAVQATVIRELVIFLRKDSAALSNGSMIAASLPPDTADTSVLKSATTQRTAKVGAVDKKRREATLTFPDGTSRSFPVRPDVDLRKVQLGEEVIIQTTSAAVLALEKR
jgi:hypothetical protein